MALPYLPGRKFHYTPIVNIREFSQSAILLINTRRNLCTRKLIPLMYTFVVKFWPFWLN